MTPENQKRYDAKLKRINDAIALREPDRVPIKPPAELFPCLTRGIQLPRSSTTRRWRK